MENEKPNVFPTREQIEAANAYNASQAATQSDAMVTPSQREMAAEDEMRRRTEQQLYEREGRLAEEKRIAMARREELTNHANQQANIQNQPASTYTQYQPQSRVNVPPINQIPAPVGYKAVGNPQNIAYDIIPMPSEGKIYPIKKPRFKVAFLNASDENLLTSPNMLENPDWFDILVGRKLLEDIDPKDLHIGDRNAIMIWLRATAYGEMYPINVVNPKTGEPIMDPVTNEPWEYEVDLSKLPIKKLGAEPDAHGLFTYELPISKKIIKFKLLTIRDIEELTAIEDYELDVLKLEYSNILTHRFNRQILEIDGNRDPEFISNENLIMKAGDSRAFRKYNDEIESGIDLRIEIRTPGGESIKSFLPLNINFFWPDFKF